MSACVVLYQRITTVSVFSGYLTHTQTQTFPVSSPHLPLGSDRVDAFFFRKKIVLEH